MDLGDSFVLVLSLDLCGVASDDCGKMCKQLPMFSAEFSAHAGPPQIEGKRDSSLVSQTWDF